MIFPHRLRMVETRAINRALRLATNIGMCSAEENLMTRQFSV